MQDKLLPGEIALCNIHLRNDKGKAFLLKDQVFSYPYTGEVWVLQYSVFEHRKMINKTKQKKDLRITKLDVLKKIGMKQRYNA